MLKGQDILLLLKLVSVARRQRRLAEQPSRADLAVPADWRDWLPEQDTATAGPGPEPYSVRALAEATGISKSEVSSSLRRCLAVGLAKPDRRSGEPRVNTKALYELIAFGVKYVFPAQAGAVRRGIATAHAAPVLEGRLLSAGEYIYVWEDAFGQSQGQTIPPLFKSVPFAVRQDPDLYAMLALTDAIRLGGEREMALAKELLGHYLLGGA